METDDLLPQALEKIREPADEAMHQLKTIIYWLLAVIILIVVVLPVFGGTVYPQLDMWADVFSKIDPYLFSALGMGLTIGLSVIGAAW